jgi:hypothetical protein
LGTTGVDEYYKFRTRGKNTFIAQAGGVVSFMLEMHGNKDKVSVAR